MAKMLFVNPVVLEEDEPRHVPYGIALLSSICIEKGHLVQVYDENAWRKGPKILSQVFRADDWDVIALGGINNKNIARLRSLPISGCAGIDVFTDNLQ